MNVVMLAGDNQKITVTHFSSESGDHFLRTFHGWVGPSEISSMVYEDNPDWWSDPEHVYVEDYVHIHFVGGS